MKVLFAASLHDYGDPRRGDSFEVENLLPPLKSHEEDVVLFDTLTTFLQAGEQALQKNLMALIAREKPDWIFFVLVKNEITPQFISEIRKTTCAVITNWFCDDSWRYESFSKGVAHTFDLVISTDKMAAEKHRKAGVECLYLPWAATYIAENTDSRDKFQYDVSFIGQKTLYREWFVRQLSGMGVSVECFGHGWKNGRISFTKMQEIFRSSKINMSISNSFHFDIRFVFSSFTALRIYLQNLVFKGIKNVNPINARNFEICGAGGFQLTNYAPFLEDHFVIGREIQIYTSPTEAREKIEYFLAHDEERSRICRAGRARVARDHTYVTRFRILHDWVLHHARK